MAHRLRFHATAMNTPLERVRLGAIVLAAVFVTAVLGYRYLGGYDWLGAVWMVVVTISTVGYSEQSQAPGTVQALSIGVILIGMSAAVYTVGGFIHLMLEGEIQTALGQQRTTREIDRLAGHAIVCGYGRIGSMLACDLQRLNRPFVSVDSEPAKVAEAHQRNCLAIIGDATEEDVLTAAGVERAATLVTVLPNDAANVFITLTARNLNKDCYIVARAEHPSTERKLRQAGADRVVMPAVTGAAQMTRMITRPSTADLMEMLAESSFMDLEMDEIAVDKTSRLVGASVKETEARRKHGLLVVAVKTADGSMVFNPDDEHVFAAQDTVIVMGPARDIETFRRDAGIVVDPVHGQ